MYRSVRVTKEINYTGVQQTRWHLLSCFKPANIVLFTALSPLPSLSTKSIPYKRRRPLYCHDHQLKEKNYKNHIILPFDNSHRFQCQKANLPSFCMIFLRYSEQRFFSARFCGYPFLCGNIMLVSTTVSWSNLRALKSLSRLWPTKIVLSENIVRRVACTSKRVVVTFFISSSVIPENLFSRKKLLIT